MPSKYRIILEMASQTARDIASNADRYTDFLITAANNYKYSFKEQLLIHAQKPDATACAEIDTWNKLGRWVNKGTKGIALLIDRDVPYKLRHVFDISDTNSRAGRNITLWQMKPEYEYAVSESLQASFGDVEEPREFPHLLMDISGYAVEDIFIDEAHYYKNLAAFTKMRNVGGISQTEAMKSSDLYMKCRYLDELTGGRGVVFATGTPISNSMVEMYTMQKYLQYGALRRNDLLHFDAWASTFGETVTAIELSPEGYTLIGR